MPLDVIGINDKTGVDERAHAFCSVCFSIGARKTDLLLNAARINHLRR